MAEENTPESGASTPDSDPPSPAQEPRAAAVGEADVPPDAVTPGDGAPLTSGTLGSSAEPARAAPSGKSGALTPGQRLAAKKAQKAIDKREFKEELKRSEEEARQKEE